MKLVVACCLWKANERSALFSQCYDETWVIKLYNTFHRNLERPWQMVCFVDEPRGKLLNHPIDQELLLSDRPYDWRCLIEPFRLSDQYPMIILGLDTIILGRIDHYVDYCMDPGNKMALVRNPYQMDQSINPIVLVPQGNSRVYTEWDRQRNDMEWLRTFDHESNFMDDLWPGEVLSYKAHRIGEFGPGDARVIYFHGKPKPHVLQHTALITQHWR